jgi:bifunctional oligoribonuclease and PAP phosphatase NrnA
LLLEAAVVIEAAEELALACHVSPDGDALGSTLAFHLGAQASGRPSVASWPRPLEVPTNYRSLPALHLATDPSHFPAQPSVMMTFDCGAADRLNELQGAAGAAQHLIVVDHHASNHRYGTINVVDPTAASTTVMVHRLLAALGWPITREIAWCLYTGLITDTGRFQFAATTPAVFALAEELTSFDLPIARINRELFDEHRFAYLKLAARVLDRAEFDEQRSMLLSSVSQQDLLDLDVHYDEVEGLIEWLRTCVEAEVTVLIKEASDGVRVSLRAKERADVGALATSFGGGGHRLASGFSFPGTIAEAFTAIRAAAEQRHLIADPGER